MEYKLKAEERESSGKLLSKKMRRQGSVPGVIYGRGEKTVNLTIDEQELSKLLDKIKGHSPIVELTVGDNPPTKAIIKTMQREALSKKLLSIDFQKIHAREKVTMNVPVILKGTAVGVKDEGGILDHPLRSIPVRCEVDKVPEHIEIDISELRVGHSIHISDLKLEGVEFTLAIDAPIVSVLVPRKIVEVAAPVVEEAAEPEVITEKKKEEAEETEGEAGAKKKPVAETETKKETKK
jgi:large subunit ribosomal protein L25